MHLVTFENPLRVPRIGAIAGNDGHIVDLNSACALYLKDHESEQAFERMSGALVPPNMRALFEGGDTSLSAARKALHYVLDRGIGAAGVHGEPVSYAPSQVRLKSPITPKKFFHTAGNFREHHEEATKAGFSHPVMPKKGGKHFSSEDAAGYVGGYVIFNDITARDIQRREMLSGVFSFCKAIDTFCPLGPWIVTADEISDPHNLAMELRVNGQRRQQSHSSKMSVKIPQILSHYSPMGYSAGDVVSTGTVSGVAAFSGDPKAWYLKPGDIMECEIEKIGILRNPVISWESAYGQKPVAPATQEAYR